MYIKICGITKLDQAQAIAQMGADALGFICVPSSPRYVNTSTINHITSKLTNSNEHLGDRLDRLDVRQLDLIGVFLNSTVLEICQTVKQGGLTAVQLHGDESPDFCREARSLLDKINPNIKLIKALRVKNQAGLEQAKLFSAVVDAILLDAYDPQMAGGTGKTLDWQMLRDFRLSCPWWLAGGLSPENVDKAIAQVCPDGLDVSSGVELAAGDKDLAKVANFMAIVRPI